MSNPLGHPDNERTKRASVDAVMLTQALHRGDDQGMQVILANCDPYSLAVQVCGFLLGTLRHFNVDTEERLTLWLTETQSQTREFE